MARLRHAASGRVVVLSSRSLVGRAHHCLVRPDDPRVSGEHASLTWDGERWQLRDLASRNGTWVDGNPVSPGIAVPLQRGARLGFGVETGWHFDDDSGPGALAVNLDDTSILRARDELLFLPDADRPEATLFTTPAGTWLVEQGDDVRAVQTGDVVVAGGRWRLELPVTLATTVEVREDRANVRDVALHFAVSRDEEFVRLELEAADGRREVPSRAFHYTLLTLARIRLEDVHASDDECGWIDPELLCKRLAVRRPTLNVHVSRARRQFAELGIAGGGGIIERRPGTGQVRLAVKTLTVRPL